MVERRSIWFALVLACGFLPATGAVSGVLDPSDNAARRRELPRCADPASACFDFEGGEAGGWESPDWFVDHERLLGCAVELVPRPTAGHALQLGFALPDLPWCATGIRLSGPFDLSAYGHISVDVYLPREIPGRVPSARFILRAGADWSWYQMEAKTRLVPGQWVTVTVPLLANAATLDIWGPRTSTLVTERSNVQEIMLRIEVATTGEQVTGRGEVLVDRVMLTP